MFLGGTLIFAAGRDRIVSEGGRLGFHGSYFPGMTDADLALANQEWAALYRAAGVDSFFIERALSVSPEHIWYPAPTELLAANVASTVFAPQVESAPETMAASPTIADVEASMRAASGVIEALHQVEPDTARRIYSYVLEANQSGTQPAQVAADIQRITAEAIRRQYPRSDDLVLVDAANLLADHMDALLTEDPALCFAYAQGGERFVEAYNRLPANLQKREIEVNERVLRSAGARAAPTQARTDAIFTKVGTAMARTITTHQLELIGLAPSSVLPIDYSNYCIAAIVMYREIANLVPSAAGDAMRFLFSNE